MFCEANGDQWDRIRAYPTMRQCFSGLKERSNSVGEWLCDTRMRISKVNIIGSILLHPTSATWSGIQRFSMFSRATSILTRRTHQQSASPVHSSHEYAGNMIAWGCLVCRSITKASSRIVLERAFIRLVRAGRSKPERSS